jgi:hypothetical protein
MLKQPSTAGAAASRVKGGQAATTRQRRLVAGFCLLQTIALFANSNRTPAWVAIATGVFRG